MLGEDHLLARLRHLLLFLVQMKVLKVHGDYSRVSVKTYSLIIALLNAPKEHEIRKKRNVTRLLE